MIKINKNEKEYLESKGVTYGRGITKTRSKHPTYYMVTTKENLELLNFYRIKHTIEKD